MRAWTICGAREVPQTPADLLQHDLVGRDRSDTVLRGFAEMGMPITREHFGLRTDDLIALGESLRSGLGIGFVATYVAARNPGVVRVLPELRMPMLPLCLTVHREI